MLELWPKNLQGRAIRVGERVGRCLLASPVLKRVLCNQTNFSLKDVVLAKLDRAQLGDFDALVVGLCSGPF